MFANCVHMREHWCLAILICRIQVESFIRGRRCVPDSRKGFAMSKPPSRVRMCGAFVVVVECCSLLLQFAAKGRFLNGCRVCGSWPSGNVKKGRLLYGMTRPASHCSSFSKKPPHCQCQWDFGLKAAPKFRHLHLPDFGDVNDACRGRAKLRVTKMVQTQSSPPEEPSLKVRSSSTYLRSPKALL